MPKSELPYSDDYAPVAERLRLFYEQHPRGSILTQLVSKHDGEITFVAYAYRDAHDRRPGATGWASERIGDGDVNAVACLENTETSAIGRALANLGFTAARERPSLEEMEKAARARQRHVNAASDILPLVRAAERCGLRKRRAESIRRRLVADTTPPAVVDSIGRILRRWIRKQIDVELRALADVPTT